MEALSRRWSPGPIPRSSFRLPWLAVGLCLAAGALAGDDPTERMESAFRASEEAKASRDGRAYLTSLLEFEVAARAVGRSFLAGRATARALALVRSETRVDPDLGARVRLAAARTARQERKPEEEASLLEEALATARGRPELAGFEAEALLGLARLDRDAGSPKAEARYREALGRVDGMPWALRTEAWRELGLLLSVAGRAGEAADAYQQALDALGPSGARDLVARLELSRGRAMVAAGRPGDALAAFGRGLAAAEGRSGSDPGVADPELGPSLLAGAVQAAQAAGRRDEVLRHGASYLAALVARPGLLAITGKAPVVLYALARSEAGEHEVGEEAMTALLGMAGKLWGAKYPGRALDLRTRALCRVRGGRAAEAVADLVEAERILGPEAGLRVEDLPIQASILRLRGEAERDRGEAAEARRCIERAAALSERLAGRGSVEHLGDLRRVIDLVVAGEDYQEAVGLETEALAAARACLGAEHAETAAGLERLGSWLGLAGNPEEAEAALGEASGILARLPDPDPARELSLLRARAEFSLRSGRREEARGFAARAGDLARSSRLDRTMLGGLVLLTASRVRKAEAKLAEAETAAKRALAILQGLAVPPRVEIAAVALELAEIWSRLKRYRDAEPHAVLAHGSARATRGAPATLLAATAERLAEVSEGLGRVEEARRHLAEAGEWAARARPSDPERSARIREAAARLAAGPGR